MKTKLEAPDWLTDYAKDIFNETVEQMGNQAIPSDTSVIAEYAQAQADVIELTKELRFEGESLVSDKGNAYMNPKMNVLMVRRKDMERARTNLGMTPKARGVMMKPVSGSKLDAAMKRS